MTDEAGKFIPVEVKAGAEILRRMLARRKMLHFLKYVWWEKEPLIIGRHTRKICKAFDKAIDRFIAGKSTYLLIQVPFRHGKSTVSSIAFPAYFLARLHDINPSLIQTGYGADLVEDFSRLTKRVIKSPEYQTLFPHVRLSAGVDNISKWQIEGSTGIQTYAGLDGGMTGKGGHLLICDDYLKNRKEARSKLINRSRWQGFNTDFRTRGAPVHICVVVATPWVVNDVAGMIQKNMKEVEDFPKFHIIRFPARKPKRNETGDVEKDQKGNVTYEYLFPERFPDEWYEGHYASLGALSAGLLDCSPTLEGGEQFKIERVKKVPLSAFPADAVRVRGWDLASSIPTDTTDPDWTVGAEISVERLDGGRVRIWVWDVEMMKKEAPERNKRIVRVIKQDIEAGRRKGVMESFGAYKDAYSTMVRLINLKGLNYQLKSSKQSGSKEAKLSDLENSFYYGEVYIPEGVYWAEEFLKQFGEFPNGDHDDICDAVQVAFHELVSGKKLLLG